MVMDAKEAGSLKSGMGIIENSSGNTGISLAMVGRALEHPVTIVTGWGVTDEAKGFIKLYGGNVVEVEGWAKQCNEKVQELMNDKPGFYYWPDQFSNPSSLSSNEELGREIAGKMKFNFYIGSMGAGSTISGVGRVLKERNPNTKVCLVLPTREYRVHGVGDYSHSTVPHPLFDRTLIDQEIRISEKEAIESANELYSDNMFSVGISSRAVFAAAKRISKRHGGNALIIFPDSRNRYMHIFNGGSR